MVEPLLNGIIVSLHHRDVAGIPVEAAVIARAACPKRTRAMLVRDALGPLFTDIDFSDWFAADGRSGTSPAMLSMVVVLQSVENLTDRDAADAVRTRVDWKYALGLELGYAGFDFSVLGEKFDELAGLLAPLFARRDLRSNASAYV